VSPFVFHLEKEEEKFGLEFQTLLLLCCLEFQNKIKIKKKKEILINFMNQTVFLKPVSVFPVHIGFSIFSLVLQTNSSMCLSGPILGLVPE
jgi:hypothetical protein